MDGRFPGKRLVERLERRTARRPRIGLSPAFYARFGLADPWLDLGEGATTEQAEEAFSFVSARPFYQMMRRLALARWRRQRREKQWASRTSGLRTAARKRFPGEARKAHFFGLRTIGASDMALPEPWVPPEILAQVADQTSSAWGTASGTPVRVRRGESAWIAPRGAPARVAERPERSAYEPMEPVRTRRLQPFVARALTPTRGPVARAPDRPAERIGRRLEQAAAGKDPLRRALAEAAPRLDARARQKVEAVLRRTEHLSEQTRVVEVRRILKQVAGARVVRTVMQEAPEATAGARPTEVARGRVGPRRKRRGLRPILGSSPSMAVVSHDEAPDAGATASPWAERKPSQTNHAGARVVRGQQVSPQLSTSPVVRTPRRVRGPDRLAPSPVPRTAPGASARVVRTESGAFTAARALRTMTAAATASGTHRTLARSDAGATVLRTDAGSTDSSEAHRTATRSTAGARTVRTATGDHAGARSGTTASQDWIAARAGTTASGEWVGARSLTTDPGDWTGATSATTRASAHAAARAMRTDSGAFSGARSGTTISRAMEASRTVRTAQGQFTGARSLRTAEGEWVGARTSTWAAERLATTGTPERRRKSLLPRMAPRIDTDTVLTPMVVETPEAAEALARKLRAEKPEATVRVVERPWSESAYTPASVFKTRRSAAQKAADRAVELPLVGDTAQRAAASTWASPVAPRAAAAADRRMRGPVAYASGSPVRDAQVVQHDEHREESDTGPGYHRRPSAPQRARPEATERGTAAARDFVGARVAGPTSRAESPASAASWTPSASGPAASTARRLRTAAGSFVPTETWLTRGGAFDGARSVTTERGDFVGARLGASRPMDWVGARVAVGSTPAYRGAFARSFRTFAGHFQGAGVWQTPNTPFVGARLGAGLSRPEMVTPQAERPELHELLSESQRGVPVRGAPGWAERATVPDRLRSSNELVAGLVGATDPAEVIEIILNRGNELKSSTLPKPVVQVIEQIRQEAWKADDAERQARAPSARTAGSARTVRTGASRSRRSARVLSGWTGLNPASSATTTGAVGDDKVSKLAKKLRNLIHLAESARTGEALREARLAHADRPDARMTEGGDISNSESAAMANVDIEALGREVLEVVVRELELRQERRQEDNDGNIWW